MRNLRLRKNEEKRLLQGHMWVFSNEVDNAATPLPSFDAGELVRLVSHRGRPLGVAYVNPHSLICARILSRDTAEVIDRDFFLNRLQQADRLRNRLFSNGFYRMVFGESDALPGLVVDRFADVYVVQINTAGMAAFSGLLLDLLKEVFQAATVVLRNDSDMRKLEGLGQDIEVLFAPLADSVMVEEGHARFEVSLTGGQKTGWFYDQRSNRQAALRYMNGARVLDLYSYVGAWGIQSAMAGAEHVYAVDSSRDAAALAEANARRNDVAHKVKVVHGDVFEVLEQLQAENHRFDVVICDPPAFIKRKKDSDQGLAGYHRLNRLAVQLLERDGILISSSCSYHLKTDVFQKLLYQSARTIKADMQILEKGQQSQDHPVHPAIAETDYLKCFTCRVVR